MKQFKASATIVIITILALVIVGGGVWYFVDKSDETADWKTYRNEAYKIEMEYPNDWNQTQDFVITKNEKCKIIGGATGHGLSEEWIREDKEIIINSQKYIQNQYRREGADFKFIVINDILDGNNRKELSLELVYYDQNCLDQLYQILSTFKFIENDEKDTIKEIGYIKSVYEKNGKKYLDIDYVEWLTGSEAIKAATEDGKCDSADCLPNGFYVRNQNSKIRTFEISNSVQVFRVTAFDYSSTGEKSINYEEFKNLFVAEDSYFKNIPFHVEIIDELITKITEQYIP